MVVEYYLFSLKILQKIFNHQVVTQNYVWQSKRVIN